MKQIKFLHCADLHLDMPFTSLGNNARKSAIRRNELKEAFKSIINCARREDAGFLFICGDLFEQDYVKKSTIHFLNDGFASIDPVEVVIIPGNHDPYIPNSYYRTFPWNKNVHILTEESPSLRYEKEGLFIQGAGLAPGSGNFQTGRIEPAIPGHINILLIHGTLDLNIGQNPYNPIDSTELSLLGMDYIALGHFHNRKDCGLGKGNIFNPGSPDPLGFDEPGDHGFFLGTVSVSPEGERKTGLEFIKLNKRHYIHMDVMLDGCSTDERVTDEIEKAAGSCLSLDEHSCVSITLRGYLDPAFKTDLSYLQEHFKDRFFFVKIKDETAPLYALEEIMKEPGIRGLFAGKIYRRLEETTDPSQRAVLMKAFLFGMEALEKGKVGL